MTIPAARSACTRAGSPTRCSRARPPRWRAWSRRSPAATRSSSKSAKARSRRGAHGRPAKKGRKPLFCADGTVARTQGRKSGPEINDSSNERTAGAVNGGNHRIDGEGTAREDRRADDGVQEGAGRGRRRHGQGRGDSPGQAGQQGDQGGLADRG